MRFAAPALTSLADLLFGSADAHQRAKGENFRWEERVSDRRRGAYEATVGDSSTEDIDGDHARYVGNRVNLVGSREEPACFSADNDLALTPCPDASHPLVRVEDLKDWSRQLFPGTAQDLKRGFEERSASFRTFFDAFNGKRDRRPMFAAFARDLDRFGDWRSQWHTALPRLLGLSHLTATPEEPRVIALFEYTTNDVLAEPGAVRAEHRFAAPTVIDHKLNPYFFPSPSPRPGAAISYGRAVNLAAEGTLVCEIIHRHFRYQLKHLKAVAVLSAPAAEPDVAAVRTAHLGSIRTRPEFQGFPRD